MVRIFDILISFVGLVLLSPILIVLFIIGYFDTGSPVFRQERVGKGKQPFRLMKPFSFYVNCFTLPNLFAGKMHALLFRKWQKRVKGRDWYDMEWYIRNGVALNLEHFWQRATESGDWSETSITKNQLLELLHAKINSTKIENAKDDVIRFVQNPSELDIWSKDYFNLFVENLKVGPSKLG